MDENKVISLKSKLEMLQDKKVKYSNKLKDIEKQEKQIIETLDEYQKQQELKQFRDLEAYIRELGLAKAENLKTILEENPKIKELIKETSDTDLDTESEEKSNDSFSGELA